MIDTEVLHSSFKNKEFTYRATFNIIDGGGLKYRVMCRDKGSRDKWVCLGNEGEAIEYPTEESAKEDVKKLNAWAND